MIEKSILHGLIFESLNEIQEAVLLTDFSGGLIYASSFSCKYLGYTAEELLCLHIWDIDQHLNPEKFESFRQRSKRGPLEMESLYQKKDGSIVPVLIRSTHKTCNSIEANVWHVVDISLFKTELRQLESQNVEIEESLAMALENAHDLNQSLKEVFSGVDAAVYIADLESHELLFVNDYMEALFPDGLGKICYKVLQDEQNSPCSFCTNDRLLDKDGKSTGTHVWEYYNKKSKRWYHITDKAIPWINGKMVRSEIALDITDLKQTQMELEEQKNLLRSVIDENRNPIVLKNYDGQFLLTNQAVADLYGVENPNDMIGKDDGDYIPDRNQAEFFRENVREIMREGKIQTVYEDSIDVNTGERRNYMSVKTPFKNQKGEDQILVVAHDITEICIAEKTLLQYEKIISASRDLLAYIDKDLVYQAVNDTYMKAFQLTREEIIGKSMQDLLGKQYFTETVKPMVERALFGESVTYEAWYVFKGLGRRFVEVNYYPYSATEGGEVEGVVLNIIDSTERKIAEDKLQYQADHDILTGLPNRRLFGERLTLALRRAQRNSRRLAVIFIDLDRFKNINDSLGHPIGDKVLKTIAKRLRSNIREEDTLARTGGDEFLILLEELKTSKDAALVCQDILAKLEQTIIIEDYEMFISGSIGVSLYPEDADNVDELIQAADTAMYQAKKMGRNTYQFTNEEMRDQVFERFFLENHLRMAIEKRELILFFQAQVDIENQNIAGAEVLLRWNQPSMGMIAPDRFIPIAEESGLINPIGKWVLHESCQQMVNWLAAGIDIPRLAVNISGQQLLNVDFVSMITGILESTGLDPSRLEIELTESYLMHETLDIVKILRELRDVGISIAVDDFGTSYSSLKHLQQLPISKLKIDQSFVRDLIENEGDASIVKAIINLARNMQMDIIAEGVETQAQGTFLALNGCQKAQGFLYHKPMPAEEFEKWLEQSGKV